MILVCCPGGWTTGGPELCHQLVHRLRELHHEAFMLHYPFDEHFEIPPAYRKYDAPSTTVGEYRRGDIVVLPETATRWSDRFPGARIFIWWLSVDNYFRAEGASRARDLYAAIRALVKSRKPLWLLRRYRHLAQSRYATEFLAAHRIPATQLTDYLGSDHLARMHALPSDREKVILYNPKKGITRTAKLIARYPEFHFVPLQGMTAEQLALRLSRSMVYIDFGHHPGKDRMPREAAAAGCCVITGRRGAARNGFDVPIPDRFKLDDDRDAYVEQFGPAVTEIFDDFAAAQAAFASYRRSIQAEPVEFSRQVEAIFGRA